MTGYNSFSGPNMKSMCQTCLRVGEEVFPMLAMEIDAYETLVQEVNNVNSFTICIVCKWMLRKCIKFRQQCRKANEILKTLEPESKTHIFFQHTSAYDLQIYSLGNLNLGPESSEISSDLEEEKLEHTALEDQLVEEKNEYILLEDHFDDEDDEMPLVMLQDFMKRKKLNTYEIKIESEIKQESDIKEEYNTEDSSNKDGKRSKKKKKEVKEGFSSRMTQETDEYVVIKLSKEQVLAELAEKAKADAYIRAPYKCEKCVKGFNFEDVLQTHMEKHSLEHGNYKCDICSQYCPNPVSLRGHLKSHTTRYKCKLCGQVRLSRQHLLEHHAISHTAAPTTYNCQQCTFTTNKRTVIQRHVKTHSSGERHACHTCGKLFNTIESLRVHTMRHDKTKRLQCEHCDKHFIYPSLLHKHTQAVHERKEYYCVECDVRFKSQESMRLHFKKAKRHRDSSSYKFECPRCPQRFVTNSTLSVHMSCAHGAVKRHACSQCRRLYSSKDTLRAHYWRVHTRRDNNVDCTVCGTRFSRKSVLKIHMRSHTGDRRHSCECGATFTQKASLNTHAAKHQKLEDGTNGIDVKTDIPQEG